MPPDLTLKPDFEKTAKRFDAWWHGDISDRPPLTVTVPPSRPYTGPTKTHPTLRDRWLDVTFSVETAIAQMEQTDYLADSFPVYWPNLGPELCATPFGCELEFSETTNWSIPIVHAPDDWNRIIETACDFWCMVSPQMARDMILPDILTEMQPLERSLFHLDGPQALPHLDLLLEIPHLNAIQWVYGAGNGPAAKWIDVYRRIRHAGKAIQLLAETPDDALTVLDAIGPKGVWICLAIPTLSQAQAFITQIEKPHS